MTNPVAMNDFERMWRETETDVLNAVRAVGQSGWYVLGKQVQAFEAALAGASSRKSAIGCANGLDAIEIGLRKNYYPALEGREDALVMRRDIPRYQPGAPHALA